MRHMAVFQRIVLQRSICAVLFVAPCRLYPQCSLDTLLADPYCLAPPKLDVGEFHADTDETSVEEGFRKHAGASNKASHRGVGMLFLRVLGLALVVYINATLYCSPCHPARV